MCQGQPVSKIGRALTMMLYSFKPIGILVHEKKMFKYFTIWDHSDFNVSQGHQPLKAWYNFISQSIYEFQGFLVNDNKIFID